MTIIKNKYRTHSCAELNEKSVGETVTLSGWIHKMRDHGGLIFVDLRDYYGMTQVVFDASVSDELKKIEENRVESVISIKGEVVARTSETINEDFPTGKIEVSAKSFEVLSNADVLPILVASDEKFGEDLRLKYRYIDLRREKLKKNIQMRMNVFKEIRDIMSGKGFNEIQTPILTASSPEGARDFLVPSRVHHGKFYALPQSPQIFKELSMVAGFDKYFQLAPCFRDEDLRSDRLLEFYQLDMEMSFVEREDVMETMQDNMMKVFNKFKGDKTVVEDIPHITYKDAMETYGIDRPDLRNPLIIKEVGKVFDGSDFGLFASLVAKGNSVKAVRTPGTSGQPRSWYDKLNDWARSEGAGGLGYIVFNEDGTTKGPIAKNLDEDRINQIRGICGVENGDSVFFCCDKLEEAQKFAGKVRTKLGTDLELINNNEFKFCWVIDFPFFEKHEETGEITTGHNPFSMPVGGIDALNNAENPFEIMSNQYDFICNGYELGGGSIRHQSLDTLVKGFEMVGYSEEIVKEKFGSMYDAYHYGVPPHGGIAMGMERIIMLLCEEPNLREVVPFPANGKGQDTMMGSPSEVSEQQLREAHIKVRPTIK